MKIFYQIWNFLFNSHKGYYILSVAFIILAVWEVFEGKLFLGVVRQTMFKEQSPYNAIPVNAYEFYTEIFFKLFIALLIILYARQKNHDI